LHVASCERSLDAVEQRAFEHERHRFESGVRMRATGGAAGRQSDPIVGEHDERILRREVIRIDGEHRGVSGADEAGHGGGSLNDARDAPRDGHVS